MCDLKNVGMVLTRNHQNHACFAHDRGRAEGWFRGFDHLGNIPESDVDSILMSNDCPRDSIRSSRLPFGIQHYALIRILNETAATNSGRLSSGGEDFLDAQAVPSKFIRLELNLEFFGLAAENIDLSYAWNRKKPLPYGPICHRAHSHQRLLLRRKPKD